MLSNYNSLVSAVNAILDDNLDINQMNEDMANTMDKVITDIKLLKNKAVETEVLENYRWPMIILRTPKGWTGPAYVDGKKIEGCFRAHQIPFVVDEDHKKNLNLLTNIIDIIIIFIF